MTVRVVTPPTGLFLPLEEAKAQLRVGLDDTDEDFLITRLIRTAQRDIEAHVQRRYLTQTLEWVRDDWCERMVLPLAGPSAGAVSIDSVKYGDLQSVIQTLDPATMYWSRPAGPTLAVVRKWFAVWPWLGDAAERVVIRFTITGTADDLPDDVKHAAMLLISHWFRNRDAVVGVENRDSSAPLPLGVEELLVHERWEA